MREKLIELLGADTCKKECEDCKYCANADRMKTAGTTVPAAVQKMGGVKDE